jgi:hypothetical protein
LPQPDLDPIELRHESLAAREPVDCVRRSVAVRRGGPRQKHSSPRLVHDRSRFCRLVRGARGLTLPGGKYQGGVGSRGDRFYCSASQRHLAALHHLFSPRVRQGRPSWSSPSSPQTAQWFRIVCRQAARHSRRGDSMKRRAFIAGLGEIVAWPTAGRVGDLLMWDHCAVRHLASFDYFYSRMHQRKRL